MNIAIESKRGMTIWFSIVCQRILIMLIVKKYGG